MEFPKSIHRAIKDLDLLAVEQLISNSKSKKDKLSILSVIWKMYSGAYQSIAVNVEVPSDITQYQKENKFQKDVIDMIFNMRQQDKVIDEFLEENTKKMEETNQNIGSGPEGKGLDHYYCANTDPSHTKYCSKRGTRRCTKCSLVGYCSESCQKEHWKTHKKACSDSLFQSDKWKPRWVAEKRTPEFCNEAVTLTALGFGVHLWGNTPAFDLIALGRNEYKENPDWEKHLKIAYAASGDFRSIVESLASIPESFKQPVTVILNDRDEVVVARNLLMLSLLVFKGKEVLDTIIGMWYSAAIPYVQHLNATSIINERILPLFENKEAKTQQLEYGQSIIELNQLHESMKVMCRMLRNKLDVQSALDKRNSVMLDPSRRDYVDRRLIGLKDYHREAFDRFRDYGLLLPFECLNVHHNAPNNFLFHPELGWVLNDSCDPTEGWDMLKVMEFGDKNKLPKNDLYGRLFFYIRDRLGRMVVTLQRLPITFRLFQKDAKILAKDLEKEGIKFDRIDVSNISDEGYVGIDSVLNSWGPLLNNENPNSAIVTLFLNWQHMMPGVDIIDFDNITHEIRQKALSLAGLDHADIHDLSNCSPSEVDAICKAAMALTDRSEEFEKYLEKVLKEKPEYLRRRMDHSIVPHKVMYPIEADRKATIDVLPESDQYFVLNWSTNLYTRYAEWTLAENMMS